MKDKGCFVLVTVVVALVCVSGYSLYQMLDFNPVAELEISRASSPDGRYDAVILSRDAGATTSTVYLVGVTTRGSNVQDEEVVLIVDNVRHPELIKTVWRGRSLEITKPHANVFERLDKVSVRDRQIPIIYKSRDNR